MGDYYVYHNPERGVMGWVPTIERFKTALVGAPIPTTPIEYQYNVELAYIKGVSALGIVIATILVAQFVFTTSFTGITFLNQASRKTTKTIEKSKLSKKFESMSVESLQKLLDATKA